METAATTQDPTRHEATAARQYVTFTVGDAEYGVDIMEVREIKGWTQATRLPNAPPYVRGVMNLRGVMVPVFDLRARFGGPPTEVTRTHVVVIVAVAQRALGILVDAVSDIVTIEREAIRPVPEIDGFAAATHYLAGLVSVGERMVALLTLDRLFALDQDIDAEIPAVAEAIAAQAMRASSDHHTH